MKVYFFQIVYSYNIAFNSYSSRFVIITLIDYMNVVSDIIQLEQDIWLSLPILSQLSDTQLSSLSLTLH